MTGNASYPHPVRVPRSEREKVRQFRANKRHLGAIVIEDAGGPWLTVECETPQDAARISLLYG